MAITKTWEVNTSAMEADVSDGYVTKVVYRVKGIDDSDNKEYDRSTGEVNFTKPDSLPSDFKAYDTLTHDQCIGWVKTKLDADNAGTVAAIEASLDASIALIKTPTKKTGVPWS
tara:strand:+ start:286 stop:627 length:342 start_codon:yes stop_codon:yes gene_type:complete